MTVPDPEEQNRRTGSSRSGQGDADPDGTDAAFEAIVADWRAERDAPNWPSDADDETTSPEPTRPGTEPGAATANDPADDDHFVPPDPPPMPALRPRTLGGLALIAVGVLLLFVPGLLDLTQGVGTPLGLLALAGGIGWLVLGLRPGPPADSGGDDGAQL